MLKNISRPMNSDFLFNSLLYGVCFLILIVTIYPIYFVLIASFSDPIHVANGRTWLLPSGITLMGYEEIFKNERIWIGYRNTIFYTVAGTLFSLVCTLPAAYTLSRRELPLRNLVMLFFVCTMFFNGGLVPTYLTIQMLGLTNNALVMIIPFAVNVFNLIIARTFFQTSIPEELFEAAKIDGCGYGRFFFQIVLPLSKAIIAVIGLYYAVAYWNEFFRALIYLRERSLIPLQLVLRDILISNQAFEMTTMDSALRQRLADVLKYALIIVATVPIMLVYPFIQRYFAKGVFIGSLKG